MSGYLYPEGDARIDETHEGQGHAWLEAWIGDWHPFDPTSGDPVAERHVLWRVAATTPTSLR